MKLRALAISLLLLFTISTASAQISPELGEKLSEKPNTTKVDVIILTQSNANDRAKEAVRNSGGNVSHDFNIIDGVAVTIPKVAAENLANRDFVREIQPDYKVVTRLDGSTSTINADQVWSNSTGEGVDVAVLDTGVEDNTILNVENQVDYTGEGTDDLNGHGTHVAGIVASPDEEYQGVAYGVDLFDVKVLDQEGVGSASDVIAGLEYAADNNLEVATLSLGAAVEECDGTSSLSEAVDNTVEQGVTVTVAAGNNGPESETITAPGCAEKPITVGSSNNGQISDFSSRGPTADDRVKPDVVAPGEGTTSLTNNEGNSPQFETLSGTSMATPHVAGTAALMHAANDTLTPTQIKNTVTSTAVDLGADENSQGSGRLDAYTAYQEVVSKNQTENETRNQPPVIESTSSEVDLLNEPAEATLTVEATDEDNETLKTTFYLESESVSEQEGYGEFTYTASKLSLNTTYEWSAEVTDGINTTTTETLEFNTDKEQEEKDENETEDNQTKPELPEQASDTARKAKAGFFNPNSPFYGFDVAFDNAAVAVGIKSKQDVMEERAQEAKKMAEKGNNKAAEKAVKNLRNTAGNTENSSKQAQETLDRVIKDSPEQAQQGLRNALENVEKERKNRRNQQKPEKPENRTDGNSNDQDDKRNQQKPERPEQPNQEGEQSQRSDQAQTGQNETGNRPENPQDREETSNTESQKTNQERNGETDQEASGEGSAQANGQNNQVNTEAGSNTGANGKSPNNNQGAETDTEANTASETSAETDQGKAEAGVEADTEIETNSNAGNSDNQNTDSMGSRPSSSNSGSSNKGVQGNGGGP